MIIEPAATLAFIPNLGWQELLILLAIGVILFGRRLPDVGRNVGKTIVEFKKGIKSATDEIDKSVNTPETAAGSQPAQLNEGDAVPGGSPAASAQKTEQ